MRAIYLEISERRKELRETITIFFLAGIFFVAPVTTEMLDAKEVHLPPEDWFDYWTAEKHSGSER